MRNWKYKSSIIMFWVFVIIIVVIFIYSLAGCQAKPAPPLPPEPVVTPFQAFIAAAAKSNWLVTVGLLTCAAGVYAFFSGNSKAVAIIAAGISLIGGVAALAAGTEILTAWLPVLKWSVPLLGIVAVGLWGYQHYYRSRKIETLQIVTDYLDKDKDGKVTIADVKAVLGI